MSPMQKAEVVEMVRDIGQHVVLAVGDGANDVAMLQVMLWLHTMNIIFWDHYED